MLSRASTLKGGENYGEDVLIPQKGEESILFQLTTRVVEDYEMPPQRSRQTFTTTEPVDTRLDQRGSTLAR
ncbi:hypothetical protein N8628_06305 [Verrucomicrobia bacterium]|nr:hypothetical protein [Verrucomicrobiota bacterium]